MPSSRHKPTSSRCHRRWLRSLFAACGAALWQTNTSDDSPDSALCPPPTTPRSAATYRPLVDAHWASWLASHALCPFLSFIPIFPGAVTTFSLTCFFSSSLPQMATLPPQPPTDCTVLPPPVTTSNANTARPSPSPQHTASTPRSSTSELLRADLPGATTAHSSQRHSSSPSTGSFSKTQRSANHLLHRAAAALDRTQTAIVNISEPVLRHRPSGSTLAARLSVASVSTANSPYAHNGKPTGGQKSSSASSATTSQNSDISQPSPTAALPGDPPSRPYSLADQSQPPPIRVAASDKKMHQTSSRLLRMTDDDRPFTRVCNWIVLPGFFVLCVDFWRFVAYALPIHGGLRVSLVHSPSSSATPHH